MIDSELKNYVQAFKPVTLEEIDELSNGVFIWVYDKQFNTLKKYILSDTTWERYKNGDKRYLGEIGNLGGIRITDLKKEYKKRFFTYRKEKE